MRPMTGKREGRRGGALLTVLWVSVALSAIAFALSSTVRTEFDRAGHHLFSTQAELLAEAGIEAAILRLQPRGGVWSPAFTPGQRFFHFRFPTGLVTVNLQAETGKLDVNRTSAGPLGSVIAASGIDPGRATAMAAGIVAFRSQAAGGAASAGSASTFSLGRASFEHLEDLLAVPGITTADLYGRYERDAEGKMRTIGALHRFLTTQPTGALDANYAAPELLRAGGISDVGINNMMSLRAQRPLRQGDPGTLELQQATGELRFGIGSRANAYTIRATAKLDGRNVSRTVSALVELGQGRDAPPIRVVRWYPTTF